MQPAEIDEPTDSSLLRCCGDDGRGAAVGILESGAGSHRMHEVVDDRGVSQRGGDSRGIGHVANGDLNRAAPLVGQHAIHTSCEHSNSIPGVDQARHESTADVAGATEHHRDRCGLAVGRNGSQCWF